jgi:hypothetical protein
MLQMLDMQSACGSQLLWKQQGADCWVRALVAILSFIRINHDPFTVFKTDNIM